MYLLATLLTVGNFIDTLGDQIVIALVSCVICLVSAYFYTKEKILENKLKTEQITSYIDSNIRLLDAKIIEIQQQIIEFKEVNKETSRSLAENTAAIRELKTVLNMLKEQLNHERSLRNRRSHDEYED